MQIEKHWYDDWTTHNFSGHVSQYSGFMRHARYDNKKAHLTGKEIEISVHSKLLVPHPGKKLTPHLYPSVPQPFAPSLRGDRGGATKIRTSKNTYTEVTTNKKNETKEGGKRPQPNQNTHINTRTIPSR